MISGLSVSKMVYNFKGKVEFREFGIFLFRKPTARKIRTFEHGNFVLLQEF